MQPGLLAIKKDGGNLYDAYSPESYWSKIQNKNIRHTSYNSDKSKLSQ